MARSREPSRWAVVALLVAGAVLVPVLVVAAVWLGLEQVVGGEEGTASGSAWVIVPVLGLGALAVASVFVMRGRRR